MRQTFFLLILLSTTAITYAQCDQLYYFQKGRVVKMATYKTATADEPNGEMVYTVQSTSSNSTGAKATVTSVYANRKGKKLTETSGEFSCHADTLKADMKTYLPSANMETMKGATTSIEGNSLAYPPNLQVGQSLPDGHFKTTTEMEMIKQTVEVDITERKVIGRETITEAGKSWECYKMTYTSAISIKSMINPKPMVRTMNTTEWYCPSFGVLKTDSGDMGKTEITYIGN
jgi:uncharacterized protein DUF3108